MKKSCMCGLVCFLFAAILIFALAVPTVGAPEVDAADEYIIADFSSSSFGWSPSENVYSARRRWLSLGERDGFVLDATSYGAFPEDMRSVKGSFAEPIDLSKYRRINYSIFVPIYTADPDAVYYTRLTLTTEGGEEIKHLALVSGGEWNTVSVDIGRYPDRSKIVSVQVSATIDSIKSVRGTYSFYIDDLVADEKIDRELSERFLFDAFSLTGGTVTYNSEKNSLLMVPSRTDLMCLEASLVLPEFTRGANALRINLINNTASDKLTVYYSTSDTEANTEDKSLVIPISKSTEDQYCYAYVGDISMLHDIKLVFDPGEGSIELLSITPVTQYVQPKYDTCGSVNSCFISDDLTTVTFIGQISREVAIENQSGQIAIYAWDGDDIPGAEELNLMSPLATGLMSARFELEWHIPLDTSDDVINRFIAVIVGENGEYKLIEKPFYLSNPERMAKISNALVPDKKAFAADDISLVGEVGA